MSYFLINKDCYNKFVSAKILRNWNLNTVLVRLSSVAVVLETFWQVFKTYTRFIIEFQNSSTKNIPKKTKNTF